jgi:integration host factor subunit beta
LVKSELVRKLVARNPHLYQRDVENFVDAILGEITGALARFDRVSYAGSEFSRPSGAGRARDAIRWTDDIVVVTEKHVAAFKTGKEVRELLNRS